ncbi:hypothetical protein M422DRAFT_257646 [Sphaerobolus stellatus SS14]|uniref:CCHC-type domain-containing protein n=1 Tax=Sphaerobolus stellatus (strain SS14) TaxID=990650 RepID=A0A0C9VNF4_SPHS4|nr:hypothetical protein M422DRAFT_257646 [Sphaerobolus stellatus SS14]
MWFHKLVFHSGYVDNANLVVKFKKGLNKSLWTMVAMMDLVPAFDNLEAWIEMAQRVVDVRETSRVFEENLRVVEKLIPHRPKPLTTVPRTLPPASPARTFNYQARLPIPVVNVHLEPSKTPDGPTSISNIVRRCCGKTGHIARFCDTTFNVCSLTVKEKEELLYGLMADLDMTENSGMEPGGEEEVISKWEDFAKPRRVNTVPSLPVHNHFSILDNVSTITQCPQSEKLLLQVALHPPDPGQNKTPFYR